METVIQQGIFIEVVDVSGDTLAIPLYLQEIDGLYRLVKNTERATVFTSSEEALEVLGRVSVNYSPGNGYLTVTERPYDAISHYDFWAALEAANELEDILQMDWSEQLQRVQGEIPLIEKNLNHAQYKVAAARLIQLQQAISELLVIVMFAEHKSRLRDD